MFDDTTQATAAAGPAATPADNAAQLPTISAASSPADSSPIATPDPTMSSAPLGAPMPADTGTYNTSAVSEPTMSSIASDPIGAAPSNSPSLPTDSSSTPTENSNNDLADLKQQALKSLSPLLSHLDQTPEEKFRTTMMMIQASDDQSLVKDAYEAAQNITDEKAKAQALLDVVNEINYFTQHGSN